MNSAAAAAIGSAIFVLAAIGTPALAQDTAKPKAAHAYTSKVVFENDKVRALESTWKPGEEAPSVARGARLVRTIKGGTLTRIYPDGKIEKIVSKDGQVRWFDATPPYAIKNETKSPVTLYSVYPK
jgi:hypothetical protein